MSKHLRIALLVIGVLLLALGVALVIEARIMDRGVVHTARTVLLPSYIVGALGFEVWRQRRAPWPMLVLRPMWSAALLVLAGALVLIAVAAAWSTLPDSRGVTGRFMDGQGNVHYGILDLLVDVSILVLTPLVWLALRRLASKRVQVFVGAVAAAVIAHLRWDDAAILPLPLIAELASQPARAAESAAVLQSFSMPGPWQVPWRESVYAAAGASLTESPERWRAYVAANRETIRTEWQASTAAREWIARLDAFEAIGDTASDSARRGHWHVRGVSLIHCAYATLLAIEGRTDEALAVVRPLLAVARKLQPASLDTSRLLAASIVQLACQHTVQIILRASEPAPASLQAVAAVLERRQNVGADYARATLADLRVFLIPELQHLYTSGTLKMGIVERVLYLPRATINFAIGKHTEMARILAEGRGEDFRLLERRWSAPSFKNPVGRLALAYEQDTALTVLKFGWRAEDHRRALLAEVQARLAEAEKREGEGAPPPRVTP